MRRASATSVGGAVRGANGYRRGSVRTAVACRRYSSSMAPCPSVATQLSKRSGSSPASVVAHTRSAPPTPELAIT